MEVKQGSQYKLANKGHQSWLGVGGVCVNSSIVDEGVLVKTSILQG